jgi:predicted ribosome quality control (RQC) complex YloA/Tae2 family protein
MYLDAFTISALVDEFLDVLVGGRIQDSIDVDETALGLEIYASHRRQYLYMSADKQTPRVLIVPDKLRRGVPKPTQIGLLFRRFVEGGVVAHVSQPAWERVLQIDVTGPEGDVSIIIEPMERRSNLYLVQAGIILDVMRRVGSGDNRYRVSLPNQPYEPPPPQTGKLDPSQLQLDDLLDMFQNNDDPKRKTHQVLTARLLGFSPLLARETVYRAAGMAEQKAADANPAALLNAVRQMTQPLLRREWQPGVVENSGRVEAYSVYPVSHLAGWRATESISTAMSLYYGAPIGAEAYDAGKEPLRGALREARARLSAKLASLERSLTDDSEREVLRQSGELILAYQYTLAPDQTELSAQYDTDAPALSIALDPKMTPLENAQRYFEKYIKAKRALADVPELVEATRQDINFLDQLATDLELAANWPEIDEVQQVLQQRGFWRGTPRARIAGGSMGGPLRVVTQDGFVVWVGRNSRQNEIVTFDKGSPGDLWLHARGVAGAHVIIKFDGRRIPDDVIEQAAAIAAYYSASRTEASVIVDVTERRHVRKIKGGGQGMVTYRNETTRTVEPKNEKSFAKS